jgi:hypothetical protein
MASKGAILAALAAGLPMFAWGAEAFQPLFVIERSQNANVVHYDAKVVDGKLDARQPVIAYWLMAATNGRRQDLNLLERSEAYGFSTQPDGTPGSYIIKIVSDKQRPIHVLLKDGEVRAETTIGGHLAYLQKIFITTRKKLTVNVAVSAELYGVDAETGESRYEKVMH